MGMTMTTKAYTSPSLRVMTFTSDIIVTSGANTIYNKYTTADGLAPQRRGIFDEGKLFE